MPTCSATAPKTAMKAMKTATKGPKSMKQMRATTAKGKSKNGEDYKSPDKNKSVTDNLVVCNFKCDGCNHKSILGSRDMPVKVNFWYDRDMPCTKTPEQLKDLVATILPSLQAIASVSNAKQVHAFYGPVRM